jgi:hypothetical protein
MIWIVGLGPLPLGGEQSSLEAINPEVFLDDEWIEESESRSEEADSH